ncbi:TIGR01212 family radical SAM protein, partial [Bacteroidales bacterium OttesenSCG-928-L03]|nr:TIGR01212 family radical SAM protein [Bacteroidales bacterium OttesenSCG-928-L03]
MTALSHINPLKRWGEFLFQQCGCKVQKISINAGFSCPNRDGSKGTGGCTYCNNQTFSPQYAGQGKSISQQLEEGIRFFSHKYPEMKYIAYFQSYTNTYGKDEDLLAMYREALAYPGVVGLIIGTRPDCMPDSLLDSLAEIAREYFLLIEYGIESTDNDTLRAINRGHTYEEAVDTIHRTHNRGIYSGAHLILGLPGE